MLVDVHAHLDDVKDINRVIANAEKAGLKVVINCGLNHKSNLKTLELSKSYRIIKPAFGLYPMFAEELPKDKIQEEIAWVKKNKPFAISEIGMDFKEPKDINKQKYAFVEFLKLAKELNIPAIIHSRKAEADVLRIIKQINHKKIVLHCFTGKKSLIKDYEGYFSIPAIILRSTHFQNLVKIVKLTRLLTETDSPYLSPFKDKPNEPANVALTVKKIAEIKGITPEEAERIIFMNYQRLFL